MSARFSGHLLHRQSTIVRLFHPPCLHPFLVRLESALSAPCSRPPCFLTVRSLPTFVVTSTARLEPSRSRNHLTSTDVVATSTTQIKPTQDRHFNPAIRRYLNQPRRLSPHLNRSDYVDSSTTSDVYSILSPSKQRVFISTHYAFCSIILISSSPHPSSSHRHLTYAHKTKSASHASITENVCSY